MKKISFFTLFLSIHICFIALYIYKHTISIKHTYTTQKLQTHIQTLSLKKQNLIQTLYHMQNHEIIQEHAKQNGFKKIKLSQISRVHTYE